MLSKMKTYIADGDTHRALIIGQNLFAQNSGDPEIFEPYFSVLWAVTTSAETIADKQRYFQQMSVVLGAFSESVRMDDPMVEYIAKKEEEINLLYESILQAQREQEKEYIKKKVLHNEDILRKLEAIIGKIAAASHKSAVDKLLGDIQVCDAQIEHDYLSERQKKDYDLLTRQCSQKIEQKLHMMEHERNVKYNLQALEAYEKVFRYFKDSNVTQDHKTVINGLFGYDASRLFNETLTYYNHVYAYVLSKLNDEEKFVLTKAAIRSEIRR